MNHVHTIFYAMASGTEIRFPALNLIGFADKNLLEHEFGTPEYPWNPDLDRLYKAWQEGESADLADGGLIYCSVSAALVTRHGTAVIQAGKRALTMPYSWGPPKSLWRSGTPLEESLNNLGTEILFECEDKLVPLVFNGPKIAFGNIELYARTNELLADSNNSLPIRLMNDYPRATHISFGEDFGANALISCEPEIGKIGLIFLFEPIEPDSFNEIKLLAGEMNDGRWIRREVKYMNHDNIRDIYLDPEAKIIAEALGYDK